MCAEGEGKYGNVGGGVCRHGLFFFHLAFVGCYCLSFLIYTGDACLIRCLVIFYIRYNYNLFDKTEKYIVYLNEYQICCGLNKLFVYLAFHNKISIKLSLFFLKV